MSYQGFKNRQTWNVALWFTNEVGLYRAIRGAYKRHGRFTAAKAKDLVTSLLPDGTPDMKGYAKVSWTEIAKDFNDMGKD